MTGSRWQRTGGSERTHPFRGGASEVEIGLAGASQAEKQAWLATQRERQPFSGCRQLAANRAMCTAMARNVGAI